MRKLPWIDDRFLGRSIKNPKLKEYEEKRLGTFGPASPVRHIDPKTGQVIKPSTTEKLPWEE